MTEVPENPNESQSSAQTPTRPGLFSSWLMRITVGLVALILIAATVGVIIYLEVKADRSKPLEIDQFPNRQEEEYRRTGPAEDERKYVVLAPVEEVEAYFRRQMDSCDQFYKAPENGSSELRTLENYVFTVCFLDRTHMLGFVQYVRVEIQPERDPDTDVPTGRIIVQVKRVWEE